LKLLFKNIDRNNKIAIIVTVLFFTFILINNLLQFYRGTWIYQYGKTVSLYISLGLILASVVNTLFLIIKYKSNFKKNIFWIFISAVPILYILMMIFLM
jgi:hypothetical protein